MVFRPTAWPHPLVQNRLPTAMGHGTVRRAEGEGLTSVVEFPAAVVEWVRPWRGHIPRTQRCHVARWVLFSNNRCRVACGAERGGGENDPPPHARGVARNAISSAQARKGRETRRRSDATLHNLLAFLAPRSGLVASST